MKIIFDLLKVFKNIKTPDIHQTAFVNHYPNIKKELNLVFFQTKSSLPGCQVGVGGVNGLESVKREWDTRVA